MSDRPTPETDYEQKIDNGDTWPLFEFARRLERERDEARETLARLRQDLADPPADVQEAVIDKLCLRSVITERNEAREQLDRICRDGFGYQDTISLEPCADYVLRKLTEERELARQLLSALKDERNFSRHFSNSSHNSRFAKMQRDTESLLAKAKEVLP